MDNFTVIDEFKITQSQLSECIEKYLDLGYDIKVEPIDIDNRGLINRTNYNVTILKK